MTTLGRWVESWRRSEIASGVLAGLVVSAILFTIVRFGGSEFESLKVHLVAPPVAPIVVHRTANFRSEPASADARRIANWAVASGDAMNGRFFLIDKKDAKIFAFDRDGSLLGAAPVLLGQAVGDDTIAGVGDKEVADVLFEERTTPAGRFLAERGHDTRGEDVVWVDYAAGISMHRVLTTKPHEHRLERLESPTIEDNRISFGCINLPVAFYETLVKPAFESQRAIVYILPEVKALQDVFGAGA